MFITEIPLDVFINICEFLNPLDVLSLGESAKQLYSFSKTRSLWISLTQRMIQSNSLYAPSFPIPNLTTRQLQQVACAPTRIIERFRNVTFGGESSGSGSAYEKERDGRYRINKQLVNPLGAKDPSPLLFPPVTHSNDRPMRIIYPPEPLSSSPIAEDDNEPMFEKICLIPGGRFLVATYGKEAILLDLGIAGYTIGNEGESPDPAQVPIYARWKHHGDDFFMPGPSCDGKELRIAMGGSFDGDNATMPMLSIVRVWEEELDDAAVHQNVGQNDNASPIRSVRVVQHYAPLPPNHVDCLSFFTLVGDLFIYAYAADANPLDEDVNTNRIHVWNFIKDESVEWEIDEGQYKELFIDGDYVVMITFPDIVGWKIPPLKPVNRQASSPTSTAVPSSSSKSIYTFTPTPVLPLYPPTFRIPLITNPDLHLTEPHQGGASNSNISSTAASVAYSLSELNDLNYNPLNDLDTMLIGRMLDWYNVDMKVRKFDAAFGRGGYYGFLSYGVDGWPVGKDGDVVDRRSKSSMSVGDSMTPAVASTIIRRDPRIVLESAMYFKGDVVNGVGLVMDPFRVCDGYTVKNVVASDGRVYIMVHDQSYEGDDAVEGHVNGSPNANGEGSEGGESGPRSLADRLWTPKKVVTVELAVPGDDKREKRRGKREYDDEDDEEEEDDVDEDETNQGGPSQGEVSGEAAMGSHDGQASMGEMGFGVESGEVSRSGESHGAGGEDDGMCTCGLSSRDDNEVVSNEQGNGQHDEGDANAEDSSTPSANVVDPEVPKQADTSSKTKERCEVLPMIPDEGAVRGRCDISFDPCTGRFCFIDKKREMIGVVDYLKWG